MSKTRASVGIANTLGPRLSVTRMTMVVIIPIPICINYEQPVPAITLQEEIALTIGVPLQTAKLFQRKEQHFLISLVASVAPGHGKLGKTVEEMSLGTSFTWTCDMREATTQ